MGELGYMSQVLSVSLKCRQDVENIIRPFQRLNRATGVGVADEILKILV
jgi:hypothetical protein